MSRSNAQATRYDWIFDAKHMRRLIERRYGTVNEFAKAKGLSYGTVAAWMYTGTQPRANMLMQALDGEGVQMEYMMKRIKRWKS